MQRSCPETFIEPLAPGRVVVMRQLQETTKLHYYVARMEIKHFAPENGMILVDLWKI